MVAELGHTHHQNHHYLATSYLPPLFSVRDKDGGRAGPYSSSESSLSGNKLLTAIVLSQRQRWWQSWAILIIRIIIIWQQVTYRHCSQSETKMVAELGHTHHQNHHYLATSYLPPLFSVRDKDGGRAGPYSSSESSLSGNKLPTAIVLSQRQRWWQSWAILIIRNFLRRQSVLQGWNRFIIAWQQACWRKRMVCCARF